MKGKWQAHERKLKGTSDYPWTAIETKMKSTIFEISLNISECCKPSSLLGTNTYEHWSKITPKSVPARKHQTLKDCCLNLFDQTVLCQVPALCDVQWQGSHSQWPCFLTNNARPLRTNPGKPSTGRSAARFHWQAAGTQRHPFSGLTHVLSASPLCASSSSSWDWHSGSLGGPFFCWGLAGRRTRFKSWHKHAAQWRYNEVYTKYNDLAMKPTKTI